MNTATVRLIGAREIRERGRARSFRVTLVISVAIVVAAIVIPKALSTPSRPLRLGIVGGTSVPLASLEKALNRTITVSAPPSETAARDLLQAKRLDAAVVGDRVLTRIQPRASDTGLTPRLALDLATILGVEGAYRGAGLSPAQIDRVAAAPPAPVIGLKPAPANRDHQRLTTLVGIILLFTAIQACGAWIINGIAAEKGSRIVEILLATVTTTELLTGKIIGIGLLAMFQVVVIAASAFIASAASGSNVLSGASGLTVLAMVGWFLLGYAYYSCLFAAGGSLVSRQEEAGNVQFPIILPLTVAYVASFSSIFSTPSPFVVVLSYLPPSAPIAMPVRVAAGAVPLWQIGTSVALLLVATLIAVRVAARVYDRAILRTGGRVTWRSALRGT